MWATRDSSAPKCSSIPNLSTKTSRSPSAKSSTTPFKVVPSSTESNFTKMWCYLEAQLFSTGLTLVSRIRPKRFSTTAWPSIMSNLAATTPWLAMCSRIWCNVMRSGSEVVCSAQIPTSLRFAIRAKNTSNMDLQFVATTPFSAKITELIYSTCLTRRLYYLCPLTTHRQKKDISTSIFNHLNY